MAFEGKLKEAHKRAKSPDLLQDEFRKQEEVISSGNASESRGLAENHLEGGRRKWFREYW